MEQQQPFNSLAPRPRFSRSMLAFIAFLGIALFFLLSEHRAHAFGYLPLILLLACPLLHMFHHGGHGGHGGHSGRHSSHGTRAAERIDGGRERGLSEEII